MGNAGSSDKVCDALYNAAFCGEVDEVVRLLPLAQKNDVVNKIPQWEDYTALYAAASQGHDKVVSALLACGASPSIGWASDPSYTPLHTAAANGNKLCVALLLLADDSMLAVKSKYGNTPVDKARKNSKHDTARAMEEWASGDKAGALRDLGAAHLMSSLTSAAKLLPAPTPALAQAPASAASSAEPVESNEEVCLDLYHAARDGKLDEVTRLLPLAKKKDVLNKVATGQGCPALMIAACNGYDKIVSFLLTNGASPRIGRTGNPNEKPLHKAAFCGFKLCLAHLLLADDSMLRVKDKGGDSPVDKARKNCQHDLAAALDKWASGDKAGALQDLGAAHLIASAPPSSSSSQEGVFNASSSSSSSSSASSSS